MIEVLIPTFNRASDIEKNLKLLVEQINDYKLKDNISISISDNFSEDETVKIIQNIINTSDIKICLYRQKENIGLEKNALFLLEQSANKFVMYLGDDDYIPDGYLKYLFKKTEEINDLSCVIPGFSALYADGTIKPSRNACFEEEVFEPSFNTVMKISQFGHQLSGLLLKREMVFEKYTENESLRNIYLFIFFVTFNILRGTSIYAPKYQVLVSQGNSKDWNYDDSGLLTEIFKNYKIAFKNSYIKRNIMNFVFMNQQSWRLRVGENVKNTYESFIHLEKNEYINLLTKILLPFQYSYLYLRMVLSKIKRMLIK